MDKEFIEGPVSLTIDFVAPKKRKAIALDFFGLSFEVAVLKVKKYLSATGGKAKRIRGKRCYETKDGGYCTFPAFGEKELDLSILN